jgi:hypothetical protein
MTLKYGEIGKGIYVGASFDLNAAPYTELTLKFTISGQSFTRDTSDGVTAPAVASPTMPDVGSFPANTYALYTTQASDWASDSFGAIRDTNNGHDDWEVCLTYEDAAPTLLHGDDGELRIEEGC